MNKNARQVMRIVRGDLDRIQFADRRGSMF
jgi:hypothetical protein